MQNEALCTHGAHRQTVLVIQGKRGSLDSRVKSRESERITSITAWKAHDRKQHVFSLVFWHYSPLEIKTVTKVNESNLETNFPRINILQKR